MSNVAVMFNGLNKDRNHSSQVSDQSDSAIGGGIFLALYQSGPDS